MLPPRGPRNVYRVDRIVSTGSCHDCRHPSCGRPQTADRCCVRPLLALKPEAIPGLKRFLYKEDENTTSEVVAELLHEVVDLLLEQLDPAVRGPEGAAHDVHLVLSVRD